MNETPNDLIRKQNEGLLINSLLSLESANIHEFFSEPKVSQESAVSVFLSFPRNSSPFLNFRNQFKNVKKELWSTLPTDSSERIDEYL